MILIILNKTPSWSAFTEHTCPECLAVDRPATFEQARDATSRFQIHYNHERPNQALTCSNRPPRQAFPSLPTLPAVPAQIDPDAWLTHWNGKHFQRKVDASGSIRLERTALRRGNAMERPTRNRQY